MLFSPATPLTPRADANVATAGDVEASRITDSGVAVRQLHCLGASENRWLVLNSPVVVTEERGSADGRVVAGCCVAQRAHYNRLAVLLKAGGVVKERTDTSWPCCCCQSALLKSANAPLAVF